MAKRLSVNLSDDVAQVLADLAENDGVTVTEVIRRSISTEKFLQDAKSQGQQLLLLDPKQPEEKQLTRVVFR